MKIIHFLTGTVELPLSNENEYITNGGGSVFTYTCSGLAGQTGKVRGSIDGVDWVDIVEFTIDTDGQVLSDVKQHTFPRLEFSGSARLKAARGNA